MKGRRCAAPHARTRADGGLWDDVVSGEAWSGKGGLWGPSFSMYRPHAVAAVGMGAASLSTSSRSTRSIRGPTDIRSADRTRSAGGRCGRTVEVFGGLGQCGETTPGLWGDGGLHRTSPGTHERRAHDSLIFRSSLARHLWKLQAAAASLTHQGPRRTPCARWAVGPGPRPSELPILDGAVANRKVEQNRARCLRCLRHARASVTSTTHPPRTSRSPIVTNSGGVACAQGSA